GVTRASSAVARSVAIANPSKQTASRNDGLASKVGKKGAASPGPVPKKSGPRSAHFVVPARTDIRALFLGEDIYPQNPPRQGDPRQAGGIRRGVPAATSGSAGTWR